MDFSSQARGSDSPANMVYGDVHNRMTKSLATGNTVGPSLHGSTHTHMMGLHSSPRLTRPVHGAATSVPVFGMDTRERIENGWRTNAPHPITMVPKNDGVWAPHDSNGLIGRINPWQSANHRIETEVETASHRYRAKLLEELPNGHNEWLEAWVNGGQVNKHHDWLLPSRQLTDAVCTAMAGTHGQIEYSHVTLENARSNIWRREVWVVRPSSRHLILNPGKSADFHEELLEKDFGRRTRMVEEVGRARPTNAEIHKGLAIRTMRPNEQPASQQGHEARACWETFTYPSDHALVKLVVTDIQSKQGHGGINLIGKSLAVEWDSASIFKNIVHRAGNLMAIRCTGSTKMFEFDHYTVMAVRTEHGVLAHITEFLVDNVPQGDSPSHNWQVVDTPKTVLQLVEMMHHRVQMLVTVPVFRTIMSAILEDVIHFERTDRGTDSHASSPGITPKAATSSLPAPGTENDFSERRQLRCIMQQAYQPDPEFCIDMWKLVEILTAWSIRYPIAEQHEYSHWFLTMIAMFSSMHIIGQPGKPWLVAASMTKEIEVIEFPTEYYDPPDINEEESECESEDEGPNCNIGVNQVVLLEWRKGQRMAGAVSALTTQLQRGGLPGFKVCCKSMQRNMEAKPWTRGCKIEVIGAPWAHSPQVIPTGNVREWRRHKRVVGGKHAVALWLARMLSAPVNGVVIAKETPECEISDCVVVQETHPTADIEVFKDIYEAENMRIRIRAVMVSREHTPVPAKTRPVSTEGWLDDRITCNSLKSIDIDALRKAGVVTKLYALGFEGIPFGGLTQPVNEDS